MEGEEFQRQAFTINDTIEPGAAELTSIKSFDQEGKYSFHMNFDPRGVPPDVIAYMIELEIDSYDVIKTK
jgi:hypothetical protein